MTMLSYATELPWQRGSCKVESRQLKPAVLSCYSYRRMFRYHHGCALLCGTSNSVDGGMLLKHPVLAVKVRTNWYQGHTFACDGFASLGVCCVNVADIRCRRARCNGQHVVDGKATTDRIQAEGGHRRLRAHQARASANLCCIGSTSVPSFEVQG